MYNLTVITLLWQAPPVSLSVLLHISLPTISLPDTHCQLLLVLIVSHNATYTPFLTLANLQYIPTVKHNEYEIGLFGPFFIYFLPFSLFIVNITIFTLPAY